MEASSANSSSRGRQPFWDNAERKQAGSGGLLSITVNPEACKGCNLCVDVCPDGALVTVKQDDTIVAHAARAAGAFWQKLPDTPQRFVNVSNVEEGIGVLPTLLLQEAELPLDGGRRRRVHGLRREDRGAPDRLERSRR